MVPAGTRLGGEAAAAAAGRLRVRIADHELRAVQALAVIDLGAHQVLQAERVDQQGDAIGPYRDVVLALGFVELEAVLEARAAAALDVDAQLERGVAFLVDQLPHLGGGGRGEGERGVELLVADVHAHSVGPRAAPINHAPASVQRASGSACTRLSARPRPAPAHASAPRWP